MALTCSDAWSRNTVANTQRVAQCVRNTNRLSGSELLDNRFNLLVLDALVRLKAKGTFTLPALGSNVEACDVQQAEYQANCAVADLAMISENLPEDKTKALIIWMLTQALCS